MRVQISGPVLSNVFTALLCLLLAPAPTRAQDRVRVNAAEGKRAVVSKVDPAYPAMARQMKIGGRVEVDVNVDPSGYVEKVDVVTGNTLLAGACVSAVKRWRFNPTALAGKPAPAVVRLGFTFSL